LLIIAAVELVADWRGNIAITTAHGEMLNLLARNGYALQQFGIYIGTFVCFLIIIPINAVKISVDNLLSCS
jgi:hypothetical protein